MCTIYSVHYNFPDEGDCLWGIIHINLYGGWSFRKYQSLHEAIIRIARMWESNRIKANSVASSIVDLWLKPIYKVKPTEF